MSTILLALLVIAGNLIPSNVNKCTITLHGKEMNFSREGKSWSMEKKKKKKVEKILFGEVSGTEFIAKFTGKDHKVDTSKLLGISDIKELKDLKKLKIKKEDYDIIKASDSIIIKSKDKVFASITWKNKK